MLNTTDLFLSASGLDGTSAFEALELFDVVSNNASVSRLVMINDGAHGEDGFAMLDGTKKEVEWRQRIEVNVLKQWLGHERET